MHISMTDVVIDRWNTSTIQVWPVILNITLPRSKWLDLVALSVLRWAFLVLSPHTPLKIKWFMIWSVVHLHFAMFCEVLKFITFIHAGWWRPDDYQQIHWFSKNPLYCPVLWWLWEYCGSTGYNVLLVCCFIILL